MSNTTRFINALLFVGEGQEYTGGELTVNSNYAQAEWSIDNGLTWNDAGDTVEVPVGTYTVQCKDVPSSYYGPTQPFNVSLSSGEEKTVTATFQNTKGKLTVTGIVHTRNQTENGGSFSIDGGETIACGTNVYLLAGTKTLTFSPITDRLTPDSQSVVITAGEDTTVTVHYYQQGYALYNGNNTLVESGMTKSNITVPQNNTLEIYKNGDVSIIYLNSYNTHNSNIEIFSGGSVSNVLSPGFNNVTIHSGAYVEDLRIQEFYKGEKIEVLFHTGKFDWYNNTSLTNSTNVILESGSSFGKIIDDASEDVTYSGIEAEELKNDYSTYNLIQTAWPEQYNVTKQEYINSCISYVLTLTNSNIGKLSTNFIDIILSNNTIIDEIVRYGSYIKRIFLYDGNIASSDDRDKRFFHEYTRSLYYPCISASRGCIIRNFGLSCVTGTYYVLNGVTSSNIGCLSRETSVENGSGIQHYSEYTVGTVVVESGGILDTCHCNVVVQAGGLARNISVTLGSNGLTLEVMTGGIARNVSRSPLLTVIAHEGSIVEYTN